MCVIPLKNATLQQRWMLLAATSLYHIYQFQQLLWALQTWGISESYVNSLTNRPVFLLNWPKMINHVGMINDTALKSSIDHFNLEGANKSVPLIINQMPFKWLTFQQHQWLWPTINAPLRCRLKSSSRTWAVALMHMAPVPLVFSMECPETGSEAVCLSLKSQSLNEWRTEKQG